MIYEWQRMIHALSSYQETVRTARVARHRDNAIQNGYDIPLR
jgi:hypothetical protein